MKHCRPQRRRRPAVHRGLHRRLGRAVIISADDPGMASSQTNTSRQPAVYAVAAGVPMLEPSDSQEAYDFLFAAFEISERWKLSSG